MELERFLEITITYMVDAQPIWLRYSPGENQLVTIGTNDNEIETTKENAIKILEDFLRAVKE